MAAGQGVGMTLDPAPQSLAAERARQTAARARAYRQRARQASVIDTAIVDALTASLGRIKRGTSIEAFVRDLALEATYRLRMAGVERPRTTFRARIDPSADSGPDTP